MADDLDISPMAAEIVLQALRPVVEHYDVDDSGAALDELNIDDYDGDAAGDT